MIQNLHYSNENHHNKLYASTFGKDRVRVVYRRISYVLLRFIHVDRRKQLYSE